MMFTCLYLASKIEEMQFSEDMSQNIHKFVAAIKEEKYCSAEKIVNMEVFLVKALRFQFVVYTPF